MTGPDHTACSRVCPQIQIFGLQECLRITATSFHPIAIYVCQLFASETIDPLSLFGKETCVISVACKDLTLLDMDLVSCEKVWLLSAKKFRLTKYQVLLSHSHGGILN